MAIEIRDGVEGKVCEGSCKTWHPTDSFQKDRSQDDGLQRRCKACRIAYERENPNNHCSKCKRRRGDFADRGGKNLYNGEEFGGHYVYCKACKVTIDARLNPERNRGGKREGVGKSSAEKRRQLDAGLRGDRGKCSGQEWQLLKLVYGDKCLHPGCDRTDLENDHVVPLNPNGSNEVWNRQPLCASHNSSKGNRSADDYRPDGGAAARAIFRLGIRDEKSPSVRGQYVEMLTHAIGWALDNGKDVARTLAGAPTIAEWKARNFTQGSRLPTV